MKRNWGSFTRKLGNNKNALLILILSVGMVSFFLSRPSYASVLDDDVELLNIDKKHMILYWRETDPPAVKIQTSSNGGKTWDEANSLEVMSEYDIEDFDGIFKVKKVGRLVATYALTNSARNVVVLAVATSDDYGINWNPPQIVMNIPNAYFIGCPALTTVNNPNSNTISLITTVVSGTQGNIYFVSSRNGGTTWDDPQQLSEIPTTCTD